MLWGPGIYYISPWTPWESWDCPLLLLTLSSKTETLSRELGMVKLKPSTPNPEPSPHQRKGWFLFLKEHRLLSSTANRTLPFSCDANPEGPCRYKVCTGAPKCLYVNPFGHPVYTVTVWVSSATDPWKLAPPRWIMTRYQRRRHRSLVS